MIKSLNGLDYAIVIGYLIVLLGVGLYVARFNKKYIPIRDELKKVLKRYEPMRRMIYQGRGRKVRALFSHDALPKREAALRKRIRQAGFWMR